MSIHNIGFYEDLTNICFNYHQNSSNTLLISSSVYAYTFVKYTLTEWQVIPFLGVYFVPHQKLRVRFMYVKLF